MVLIVHWEAGVFIEFDQTFRESLQTRAIAEVELLQVGQLAESFGEWKDEGQSTR